MMMTYEGLEISVDVRLLVENIQTYAETLREKAVYKTGSISPAASAYLWTLCEKFKPQTVIEIGTFIGNSTLILAGHAKTVYTCDKDNDCIAESAVIKTYPKTRSTDMLLDLVQKNIKADLFFFDGRIQGPDLALILRLSHPFTVYLFDDYERMEKGTCNVGMLYPYLKDYTLVHPPKQVADYDTTTCIAGLIPKEL